MITLIHDGDHGGDDFITSLLLLAHPDRFNLLGVTTVFGNTGASQASLNALRMLTLANRNDVPVHEGAQKPLKIEYLLGDDAFGSDGLGGIEFDTKRSVPNSHDAILWIAEQLRAAEKPLTICATGPLTNMAHLLTDHPDIKSKIERIVIMGGGTNPAGNITPYAEFNFYMDPDAAEFVLNSSIPMVLHTLTTTQLTAYSPERQEQIRALVPTEIAAKLDAVMRITEGLDIAKFKSAGAFFHDHHVAAYLAMPENYETAKFKARVLCAPDAEAGRLVLEPDASSSLEVVTGIKNTDFIFDFILSSLRKITQA